MSEKLRIRVLTGAGISAESGLKTFRASNGLWEQHRIEEVATPEAWERNPELVLRFYNLRRAHLGKVEPNAGHFALARLEKNHDVCIVTQNVDDLHERAGSSQILHLHGELTKVRSTGNPSFVQDIGYRNLSWGDTCPAGHQLRPHIVWFGEDVPMISKAAESIAQADVLLVIGTSLNVYPAAGLIQYAPEACRLILIDPDHGLKTWERHGVEVINEKATIGIPMVAKYFD